MRTPEEQQKLLTRLCEVLTHDEIEMLAFGLTRLQEDEAGLLMELSVKEIETLDHLASSFNHLCEEYPNPIVK